MAPTHVFRNIAVLTVIGLTALSLVTTSVGADTVAPASAVVGQATAPESAPVVTAQADPVSSLFGLLLESLGLAVLGWGEGIMNAAIGEGSGSLLSWQIGKFVWDIGCQLGIAGEQLNSGLPPTFPTKCTLWPRWPY